MDFSYDAEMIDYDEFAYFGENLAEWGLERPTPHVRRAFVAVEGLRQVSALVWGDGPPEMAFIHGSAQNAHTFDTVALALDRPLVALDLPHHGHSDASFYGPRALSEHARDLDVAIRELSNPPLAIVAMSYGGLVSVALLHEHPELASQLFLIDITPGISTYSARHILDFIEGPESFTSFDKIFERTKEFNAGRSEISLRRGIMHNALERPDGSWVWRHQRHGAPTRTPEPVADLWQYLEELAMPVSLVRAMGPSSVVTEEDVEEFRHRRPHDEIIEISGASHSVQGSHPLELAAIIAARL
ncbi:MAG: alpha/beta hydrolase [Acidimicrobiaceae bacterium]|nr:alpha/beta hydrolase [Acidimicrobiaceae bacterium]